MKISTVVFLALAGVAAYAFFSKDSYASGFNSGVTGWTEGLGAALASKNPQAATEKYINSTPSLQPTGKALSPMIKATVGGKTYSGKVQDLGPTGTKFVGIRKPDTDAAGKTAWDKQIEKNKAASVGMTREAYRKKISR